MARQPPSQLKCDISTNRAYVRWRGEKKYFGKCGSPESQIAFARWLEGVIGNPTAPAPPNEIKIASLVERYLIHAKGYYPPQEFRNLRAAMATLLAFDRPTKAINFGPKRLKEIQSSLAAMVLADGKTLKYARSTINARIDRVRRCIRWCVSEELIPESIISALDTVPGIPMGRGLAREPAKVKPVALSAVKYTMEFMSPTVRAMTEVQYLCGMRPQDVCRMTTSSINREGDIWIYSPPQHKTSHLGQSLIKAIPIVAQEILKPFLRSDDPDAPLFDPRVSRAYHGNLPTEPTEHGPTDRYSTSSYGRSIKDAIKQANKAIATRNAALPPIETKHATIPHWQPNQLRHAIGTELRAKIGIEAAQAYLGHAKPDTTLIYAEQTEAALREIARGIVSPISPQPKQIPPPPEQADT